MSEQKISKKVSQLLADLNSSNPAKVTAALDSLQVYGNFKIIVPLFETIASSTNNQTKKEIIEFLSNLKDSASKKEVISNLQESKFKEIQNQILAIIWNSPLDYSEYLAEFVRIGVENDFLITLECLTILENLEGPFDERSLMESQLLLKEYAEGQHPQSAQKDTLISEIAILIKDFDRNNQEFD